MHLIYSLNATFKMTGGKLSYRPEGGYSYTPYILPQSNSDIHSQTHKRQNQRICTERIQMNPSPISHFIILRRHDSCKKTSKMHRKPLKQ